MENLQKALNLTLEVLRSMQFSNTPAIFERHFKNLKVAELDENGVLVVIAPDDQVNTLNSRFRWMLLSSLRSASSVTITDLLFISAEEYALATADVISDTADVTPDKVSPLGESTEDVSGITPDNMSPVTESVSSVTMPEGAGEENLAVEITWSGDYDRVVQPERIIAIPRYFLRHIACMGVENAWMYIGFRQAAYQAGLHNGTEKVDIPSRRIARWAGIHLATFWRRFAKAETWTALKGFVSKGKPGDWIQGGQDARPHQAPNRYRVSMTIPLTPQDVCTLRRYLINQAEDCGIEEAVNRALAFPPKELLFSGNASAICDPMTVYDLVTSLGGSPKAANALQAHIINYQDILVMTQFFVETWLPKLKPGAAWMIAWMRDICDQYGNATASLQEIMNLTGMTREKTIREWLLDDVVKLFVNEISTDKVRGTTSARSFYVSQNEPLKTALGADVTHRSLDNSAELGAVIEAGQLGANATHRSDNDANELGAIATHREANNGDELGAVVKEDQLGANATHSNVANHPVNIANQSINIATETPLGAIATHRRSISDHNWARLRYQLGANATVKIKKESLIKLIKVKSSTSLNLINSINNSGAEKNFSADPDPRPAGDTSSGVEEDASQSVSLENDSEPEKENLPGTGSNSDVPDERSEADTQLVVEEESETESIDPQVLFEDILKRADASLKTRKQLKGKPFYPFLCWLIQGASRDRIDDPVAFAISRYDNGLPTDENIRGLAYDPDELLDSLEDSVERWMVSPLLRRVFGERLPRVKLLAKIMGVEDAS